MRSDAGQQEGGGWDAGRRRKQQTKCEITVLAAASYDTTRTAASA
jgi:hypothetical protein